MSEPFCFEDELDMQLSAKARVLFAKIQPLLYEWQLSEFYIAGGCFGADIRDIDLFPVSNEAFQQLQDRIKDVQTKPIYESKNALTFECDGLQVQVCQYCYPTLQELVDTFDFAHIQVGVFLSVAYTFDEENRVSSCSIARIDTYYTDDYARSLLTRNTWYTLYDVDDESRLQAMFPLSSMLRAVKYKERGLMSKSQYATTMIRILYNLLRRGFSDYGDFKNQLDAIDLVTRTGNPYAPDFKGSEDAYDRACLEFEPLMQVYHMLHHNGKIRPASDDERDQVLEEIETYEYKEQGSSLE